MSRRIVPSFRLAIAHALALLWSAALGNIAAAGQYVNLGLIDGLAVEPFPTVRLQVFDPATNGNLGPQDDSFVIDTGSNFITVVRQADLQLAAAGYQTVANYFAPGAPGQVATRISAPYDLQVTDSLGAIVTLNLARMLSTSDFASEPSGNRLGMPALLGRVTTIDFLTSVNSSSSFADWQVRFSNNALPSIANRYHLPIELLELPLAGQQNENDPAPSSAPVPIIEVKLQRGDRTRTGRFLIDTTKTLTSISHDFALEMGFDTNGDGSLADEDSPGALPIDRLGGASDMLVLNGDRLRLVTDQGIDLVLGTEILGVYEPPAGVDGILGFDVFTAGWFDRSIHQPGADDGHINQMHLDLNASDTGFGQLVLDLSPAANQLVTLPAYTNTDNIYDVTGDGDVAPLDVLVLINYINSHSENATLPIPGPGEVVSAPFLDVSGDNTVSALDVLRVINHINSPSAFPTSGLAAQAMIAVPEPSTGLLLGLAGIGTMAFRFACRRQRSS